MSERHPLVLPVTAEANFVLRMRLMREARGISQAEVAARVTRMGVPLPQQTIARIETGKRSLRLDEAAAIARALNVELPDLMSAPVEVRNARKQLQEAQKRLQKLGEARFDAEVALEHAERARLEQRAQLQQLRDEEAQAQAAVEHLRAEIATAQNEGDKE
ncbi:helix-turn-helix domain-containing protein [Streptomyces tendae]|uniref:helix-turn-helix domain-containing protein n=1 Tax=Streptomyces tendae TaxID=1932 RepID=UPI003666FE2B